MVCLWSQKGNFDVSPKSKSPLPAGFIVSEPEEDEEENDEQSVSDIPEGGGGKMWVLKLIRLREV